jgi:hypothetical protein
MDKKIKDAIKELKEISGTLFQSGDLGLKDHGEVMSELGRAEQMLLAADEKYDMREKGPEEAEGQENLSIRDQLNSKHLHA